MSFSFLIIMAKVQPDHRIAEIGIQMNDASFLIMTRGLTDLLKLESECIMLLTLFV